MFEKEISRVFPGFKKTNIVQSRVEIYSDPIKFVITDDKYTTFTKGSEKLNVRTRYGEILEVYPCEDKMSPLPPGKWSSMYGFSPSALSWPELDHIDWYLTCKDIDERYAPKSFFDDHEYVTPRWDDETKKVTMIYGSITQRSLRANHIGRLLLSRFPKTSFLSMYYLPSDLKNPRSALVIV
jgi:hypothetical protein